MKQKPKPAKLKPCPHCGSSDIRVFSRCWVNCRDCGAETEIHDTRAKAIAAWNRRTPAKGKR